MDVTIVGGGFGGVKAALELAKNSENSITLISDREDFQYYPALYSSATGHSRFESWIPLSEIFSGKPNIQVYIDRIVTIDADKQQLNGASGVDYTYKTCILALGSVTTYFDIKGLDKYSYGIKSASEIRRLKQHLYQEVAEDRRLDRHYIVVGGGPTGVELAGMLGEYLERLCKKYKVARNSIEITVIEAAPRILPKMSDTTSRKATQRLHELGVKVETNMRVEAESADSLTVNGKPIKTKTVVWTSGVANNPFFSDNSQWFTLAKNGRVVVDDYLQAGDNLYVIGDNAATPFGGLAQTALRDAVFVAHNLERRRTRRPLKKYKAVMPPVVVPIGHKWAAFEWRAVRLYGWIASVIRRAADVIGYHDILPLGDALERSRSAERIEDDYFTPTKSPMRTKGRRRS